MSGGEGGGQKMSGGGGGQKNISSVKANNLTGQCGNYNTIQAIEHNHEIQMYFPDLHTSRQL
jgi:hypothetical protein